MPLAEALGAERLHRSADDAWWVAAPALQQAIEAQPVPVPSPAYYRLGDVVLQVTIDHPRVLAAFEQLYGDCALSPSTDERPTVRCTLRCGTNPRLILLTFEAGAPPDPAALAVSLLRATPVAPPYTAADSPLSGWRLAGGAAGPVLAACGPHVLIDPQAVPPEFLAEYVVSATLAAQAELLVVHAASLRMGAGGILLAGPSHAGKTTTALHLALRGHPLLGDEAALIRLGSGELLPLPRTMNLRQGPRAAALAEALERLPEPAPVRVGGTWTRPLRIDELFPDALAGPTRLRAVGFLGGFADRPSLAPLESALHNAYLFECLSTNDLAHASWGLTPERRTLRILALRQVLARVPCWLITVGPPDETAELIERTMEGLQC
jgi:hypothetical protein